MVSSTGESKRVATEIYIYKLVGKIGPCCLSQPSCHQRLLRREHTQYLLLQGPLYCDQTHQQPWHLATRQKVSELSLLLEKHGTNLESIANRVPCLITFFFRMSSCTGPILRGMK